MMFARVDFRVKSSRIVIVETNGLTGIGRVHTSDRNEDTTSGNCRLILLSNIYETITGLDELTKTTVI
jgi:hypothetical protein